MIDEFNNTKIQHFWHIRYIEQFLYYFELTY